jgi:hypothetical protein
MPGDFSRFTPDSFNRYIGTFMQQGRVQLDSDWNENVVNFLNMLRKQSRDFLGKSACVGDSFRIGKDIPIDHMLQTSVWNLVDPSDSYSSADKRGYIFLNTNDRPRADIHSTNEKASLFVENAKGIFREFNSLDLSRFRSIYVRFKVIGRSFQIADNYNSSSDHSSQSIPVLTLRVHTQKEENSNQEGKYEYEGQFIGPPDAGGFFKVKFDLLQPQAPRTSLDKHDISHISKLYLQWDEIDDKPVCIGLISAEPMAVIVSADAEISKSNPWTNTTNASNNSNKTHTTGQDNNNSFFTTYKGKPTIMKEKGKKEMSWSFSKLMNFNSLDILRFSISRSNNSNNNNNNNNDNNGTSKDDDSSYSYPKLFLVNSNNNTLVCSLTEQKDLSDDSWRSYSASIEDSRYEYNNDKKVAADDLNEIKRIGLKGLPENDILYISEILGELNFKDNFLISGDIDLNLSSRMYVNGILCSRENWDSYLTQKDIFSSAGGVDYFRDYAALSQESQQQKQYDGIRRKKGISYMVYADVWNRGITHLEDPEIREVALGGADTATKLQTISQIKLKEIPDDLDLQQKIGLAEYEIRKMTEEGSGRLSVIYPEDNSPLSNPENNLRTLGNHLYRIQIHDSGTEGEMKNNIKNRATFKWSKNNASLAFAVKKLSEKEVVLDQGGRRLDNVFRIGNLIEIIDDIDELSEQPRGHVRRITHIDVDRRALSWSAREESSEQMGIRYLHEPVPVRSEGYRPELHPKVILWDGIEHVNTTTAEDSSSCNLRSDEGSSSSDSALRIKFHPGSFRSGDYWNFTTRSNGKVELLKSAKPIGPKHDYALLALIRKEIGKEIEIIEDLRHVFQPLTDLKAIDISYDIGNRSSRSGATTTRITTTTTVQAAIQRLSEGRLRILPGHGNNNTIKDLAIEAGEIYELKPVKGKPGAFATVITFNDIYQHQPLLMYTIKPSNSSSSSLSPDVRHEIHMLAKDLDDQDGKVFEDPIDDGTKNYAWGGFEIEAEENAQISWLALGDSYTYFERFVKKVLDEIFLVFFGVDSDQLKQDSSILNAWHKNLQKMSDSGPDLAKQAGERWGTLQNDFDRWVRNADKQLKNFQEDAENIFDFENDDEGQEKKEKGNRQELLKPLAQTIKCPSCGSLYPKENKYTFCTKCRAELPVQ